MTSIQRRTMQNRFSGLSGFITNIRAEHLPKNCNAIYQKNAPADI